MGRDRWDLIASLGAVATKLEKREPGYAAQIRDLLFEEVSQEGAIAQRRAARILGVSEETVDSWLEVGVLAPARTRTSDTTRVDPKSLLQVKEKLDRLRECGLSRRAALGLMRGAPRIGGPEDRPWEQESVELTDEYLERLRRGEASRSR